MPEGGFIACISGRGTFDDVVSAMLSQLLERSGVAARRVPHSAVSRERIAQLDLSGVQVIVVSYLDLAGSPAHLRYLVRRLRQHAPHASVIVLSPLDAAASIDPALQQAVAADRHVGSLGGAIESAMSALGAAMPRAAASG
jgi:hypothetical protein